MAPLHKFNPVRLAYIRDQATAHFYRDPKQADCLSGLRILDIGCGGGILSEPLARLGASMVGADPSEANIEVARSARRQEAASRSIIATTTAEDLADAGERFDIVLAMEVVEHVTDVDDFVRRCGEMVKPGGMMIAATHQPHHEELRARHRRRRIRPALAAARHASLGQVRHARKNSSGAGRRRICASLPSAA